MLCACCVFADKPTESVLGRIRASVVKVEVVILPGAPPRPFPDPKQLPECFQGRFVCIVGTGIVVNSNGDVITASHVATDSTQLINALQGKQIVAHLMVGISFPNIESAHLTVAAATSEVNAEIKAVDPLHDLALLHVPNLPVLRELVHTPTQSVMSPGWPAPVNFAPKRAQDAEPIFACGFPLGESALVTTQGSIASAWSDETVLTARNLRDARSIDIYKLNLQSTFGNSGGPVFRSSDQAVIGIIIEGSSIPGGAPTAVPSKYVTEFLTQNGVAWQRAKKK
jgi:S1-C subfamily serine protease